MCIKMQNNLYLKLALIKTVVPIRDRYRYNLSGEWIVIRFTENLITYFVCEW